MRWQGWKSGSRPVTARMRNWEMRFAPWVCSRTMPVNSGLESSLMSRSDAWRRWWGLKSGQVAEHGLCEEVDDEPSALGLLVDDVGE